MSSTVITVKGLGKQYRIGPRERYKTLRESLMGAVANPFRRFSSVFSNPKSEIRNSQLGHLLSSVLRLPSNPYPSSVLRPPSETIWALKDVSFEVQQGDVVGIIGPNGAGKTTLLKILSRITEPTKGEVELKGRVASLLEVGTGFHPELTGRENIYLNGAILGMSKAEINSKFDEIVAFAEIEKFLDTPVKHYSTGMGTRLAFAIAAHLEPEILLVDEVLSVGDMAFRKKCLGKMQDVSYEGRTVLFVSHEMNAIRRLCKNGIWLDRGRMKAIGPVDDVVRSYEASVLGSNNIAQSRVYRSTPPRSQKYFTSVSLTSKDGEPTSIFRFRDLIYLTVDMDGNAPRGFHFVEWSLYERSQGFRVAWGSTCTKTSIEVPNNCQQLIFRIGPIPLSKGTYTFSLAMGVAGVIDLDSWSDAITFEVYECNPENDYEYTTQFGPLFIPYSVNLGEG